MATPFRERRNWLWLSFGHCSKPALRQDWISWIDRSLVDGFVSWCPMRPLLDAAALLVTLARRQQQHRPVATCWRNSSPSSITVLVRPHCLRIMSSNIHQQQQDDSSSVVDAVGGCYAWEDRKYAALAQCILPLTAQSHKGSSGRIAVIGGSERYTGAP
jgi:hypothetical protein